MFVVPRIKISFSLFGVLLHFGLGRNQALVEVLSQQDFAVEGGHLLVVVSHLVLVDLLHVAILRGNFPELVFQLLVVYLLGSQLVLQPFGQVGQPRYFQLVLFLDLVDLHALHGLQV